MNKSPARHSLGFAREAMGAIASAGLGELWFAGVATDSRAVTPARLFFALPGARVDGFEFCAAAARAGAAAVVVAVERGQPADCPVPILAVPDPRRALGDLARAVRRRFRGRIVGITGSNGKTTTRALTAAALSAAGAVHQTAGNLNTDVGLPVTVLEASGNEAFWVLEMAMRARGEIAYLAAIAEPDVAVVTNVSAAHLGRLGSLAEIARAKGEIFGGLRPDGVAVLPANEPLIEAEAARIPEARKLRFAGPGARGLPSDRPPVAVRVLDFLAAGARGSVVRLAVGWSPQVVRLPLAGEHNAENAAAALAVCLALGVLPGPAAAALAQVQLPPHRSRTVTLGGRMVIDDCYNANPASMNAALAMLVASARPSARSFAVLGDMLELGADTEDLHRALGRRAAGLGLAGLVAVGPQAALLAAAARDAGINHIVTTEDPIVAGHAVAAWSQPGDWVLVKGSRGIRLERVLEALQVLFPEGGP